MRFSVQSAQRGKSGTTPSRTTTAPLRTGNEVSVSGKVLISGFRIRSSGSGNRIQRLFFSNLTLFFFPRRRKHVAVHDSSRKEMLMTPNTNRKLPTPSPTSLSRRQRSAASKKALKDSAKARCDQREVKQEFLPEVFEGSVSMDKSLFSMIN